ncbi:methenyltetrahydrofolate synthase domain-containing protein-like isoform X1 [Centruroides sculpturatus]|uniref:methenyltetrahydrofolate synthase domain-containing protein-like isoform X1 n=1 Tax=Centruroides sculpturatus TaxID=218467 RepID=UPI000C6EA122|nr:methenyltetrahydrofolate synthase domain-containing protein-like isoform X1 [Centruroides sculpturatus]
MAEVVTGSADDDSGLTITVTKESIRQKVWTYLEKNDLACFPRPVYHRIPNFKGANEAAAKVAELEEFKRTRVIKVNPDKPQEHVRFLVLEANKTLLVPTPRLRSGLLNRIVPPLGCNKNMLRICSTSRGVKEYSVSIDLQSKIKIDLIITGSVAVSLSGERIGKGEGYADMEYAMMRTMGAIDENTVVVTTVHDCQVFDSLPSQLFKEHDLPVDIIITPKKIIRCQPRLPKPKCINWSLITKEKYQEIPILQKLQSLQKEQNL